MWAEFLKIRLKTVSLLGCLLCAYTILDHLFSRVFLFKVSPRKLTKPGGWVLGQSVI